MALFFKVLIALVLLTYPIFVFIGFTYSTPFFTNIFIVCVLAVRLFLTRNSHGPVNILTKYVLLLVILICISGVFLKQFNLVKIYPIILNISLFFLFADSLRQHKTPIIELLAKIREPLLPRRAKLYTRVVTKVWMIFFLFNGLISGYTFLLSDIKIWTLYNGLISYFLIASIFSIEFLVRTILKRKWSKKCEISLKTEFLDEKLQVVATAEDFFKKKEGVKNFLLNKTNAKKVSIKSNDIYLFSCAFVALCELEREIIILPNYQPETINEYSNKFDEILDEETLRSISHEEALKITTSIVSLETKITLFTSGSQGSPQVVDKTLKNLIDECECLSQTFSNHEKSLSLGSISHQHIYGLLFRVLWPLIEGDNIGSFIVEFPERLGSLCRRTDSKLTFVSSPAFLKRLERAPELLKKDLFINIFSSGGPLSTEAAIKSFNYFGKWPWEVYGSTETGGVSYRTQKNSNVWWNFFTGVKGKTDTRGCLLVASPYLECEFQTNDLVELGEGDKFKLLGRVDRTVKIEEKRLSLEQLEKVLKGNKNIYDAHCVVLEEGGRSVVGCLIALNSENEWKNFTKIAKVKALKTYLLQYFEPVLLPRKFRFLSSLPYNSQSKLTRSIVLEYFDGNKRDQL